MSKGSGKRKGGQFEREVSVLLSKWWTNDEHEDIYWRTSTSGGRATVRSQKGKATRGQHGDICATNPDGVNLLKVCTIELKTGYTSDTIQDLLDINRKGRAAPKFSDWVHQAIKEKNAAESFSYIIIVKRNNRIPLICMGLELHDRLKKNGVTIDKIQPCFYFRGKTKTVRDKKGKAKYLGRYVALFACPLQKFLDRVGRKDIDKIASQWRKENQSEKMQSGK